MNGIRRNGGTRGQRKCAPIFVSVFLPFKEHSCKLLLLIWLPNYTQFFVLFWVFLLLCKTAKMDVFTPLFALSLKFASFNKTPVASYNHRIYTCIYNSREFSSDIAKT